MSSAAFPFTDRGAKLRGNPALSDDTVGERCLFWYLVLTPLWWASGTLLPLALAGTFLLFVRRPPRDRTVLAMSLLWFLVGGAQALSGVVNWSWQNEPWTLLPYRMLTMPVTGWVLLGAAIGVGAEYRLASQRIVRSLAVYGAIILLASVASLAIASATGWPSLALKSPIAILLPQDLPSVKQQFTMRFFITDEEFLGYDNVRRLVLFFPWSTGLAMAGMTVMLAAWRDRSLVLRFAAIGGGVAALAGSMSRAGAVAAVVAICTTLFCRLTRGAQLLLTTAGALTMEVASLAGYDPASVLSTAWSAFTDAREGSSEARTLVYRASLEGFYASPIFGNGHVGPLLHPWVPMPIGSHSSFYGLLYTGGIVTFGMFAIAYIATLVALACRLRHGGYATASSFALWIAVGMIAYGEGLFSLVPSCLVMFVWIGGGLSAARTCVARSDAAL